MFVSRNINVKELLSCFLFKQFTTTITIIDNSAIMSKSYYRVSFLSNSQPLLSLDGFEM